MTARVLSLLLFAALNLTAGSLQAAWHGDVQEKMGTRVEIQLWSEDAAAAEQLLEQGMAELDRIETLMSTYIDASEMSRVNRHAG